MLPTRARAAVDHLRHGRPPISAHRRLQVTAGQNSHMRVVTSVVMFHLLFATSLGVVPSGLSVKTAPPPFFFPGVNFQPIGAYQVAREPIAQSSMPELLNFSC